MADLPPVPDKVHVERVNPVWWGDPGENVVSLIGVHCWPDHPQPFTDTVDMGINGHDGEIHVKHQDTGSCFGSHAGDAAQVLPGFLW